CLSFVLPHRPHPVFHSFPTRRSSDLGDPDSVLHRLPVTALEELHFRARTLVGAAPSTPHPSGRVSERPWLHAATLERAAFARRQDRKSTRLNSSHVKISYAIFCLKKT